MHNLRALAKDILPDYLRQREQDKQSEKLERFVDRHSSSGGHSRRQSNNSESGYSIAPSMSSDSASNLWNRVASRRSNAAVLDMLAGTIIDPQALHEGGGGAVPGSTEGEHGQGTRKRRASLSSMLVMRRGSAPSIMRSSNRSPMMDDSDDHDDWAEDILE